MKQRITKVSLIFLLAAIVHADDVPAFKRHVIQVPSTSLDWLWPYWHDINKDGLTDLLAVVHRQGKVFFYVQNASGFPPVAGQSLDLPEGTAWCTVCDVNKHPGDEILISTANGLAYYRQSDGVFEKQPQTLLEAKQVFVSQTTPTVFDLITQEEDLKSAIPLIFADHTVLYELGENYQFRPAKRIELEFKKTIEKDVFNSWSLGSRKSEQIRIRTIAQAKSEDREQKEPTKENEYIREVLEKTKDKELQGCFVQEQDVNKDGNKDTILLHLQQDIGVRTNVIIFYRRKDHTLPEKPDQILRCRGMPIMGDYPRPSYCSAFFDINNDGFLDIVLMELKTIPTSAGDLMEILASKGMTWTLTVRVFKQPEGFSNRADFRMDFRTMLPVSESFEDVINLEGDFNADGRNDLIVRRSPTESDIYLSSVRTGFFESQPKLQLEVPADARTSVEDLNDDGVSDIYLLDYEKGRITVFLSKTSNSKGPS